MDEKSTLDLQNLFSAQAEARRWKAECENADARYELARTAEARAYLLSQHEPVAALGINRDVLRVLLKFTAHHDIERLKRDVVAFAV